MKLFDILKMCFQNLFKRFARTFMTVSGVTIGTSAVIVMISLGIGLSQTFNEFMLSMGDLTTIYVWGGYNYNPETGMGEEIKIDQAGLAAIQGMENVVGVKALNQLPYEYAVIHYGDYIYRDTIYFVDLGDLNKFEYTVQSGDLNNISSEEGAIVIGGEAVYSFYDYTDEEFMGYYDELGNLMDPPFDILEEDFEILVTKQVMNDELGYKEVDYEEIFANEEYRKEFATELSVEVTLEPNYMYWESVSGIFIDISLAEKIVELAEDLNDVETPFSLHEYGNIQVRVDDIENVEAVEKQIKDLGFETNSFVEQRKTFETFALAIQIILGGLAGISLFVAAIGISNTMVMSITERTKEIGIMKVIGCDIGDIRKLFLVESGLIGLFGGIIGAIISFGLSGVVNSVLQNALLTNPDLGGGLLTASTQLSIIPIWLVLFALAFATLVGLVSGFSPANKAVKISPLEAIKHQ